MSQNINDHSTSEDPQTLETPEKESDPRGDAVEKLTHAFVKDAEAQVALALVVWPDGDVKQITAVTAKASFKELSQAAIYSITAATNVLQATRNAMEEEVEKELERQKIDAKAEAEEREAKADG